MKAIVQTGYVLGSIADTIFIKGRTSMRTCGYAIACMLVLVPLFGAANDVESTDGLTRAQILKITGLSAAVSVATIAGTGTLDTTKVADLDLPLWFYSTIAMEHLPLYALDPAQGIKYSGIQAGLLGLHLATQSSPFYTLAPFNIYLKTSFYSTYQVYKTARNRAKPGAYQDDWKPYSFKELLRAPFQRKNLRHPIVWGPIAFMTFSSTLNILTSDDAVHKTGEAYIDDKKVALSTAVPLALGLTLVHDLATAIGEEVLYRGVVYEELRVQFGSKKAKMYDMLLFPTIHIPFDLARGAPTGEIAGMFILRSIWTLMFDIAYDKGGLAFSIPLHAWTNFANNSSVWLGSAGVPSSNPSDQSAELSLKKPVVMFRFSIIF